VTKDLTQPIYSAVDLQRLKLPDMSALRLPEAQARAFIAIAEAEARMLRGEPGVVPPHPLEPYLQTEPQQAKQAASTTRSRPRRSPLRR
jgi:hypothetical protein